jgi:hypothetical protein
MCLEGSSATAVWCCATVAQHDTMGVAAADEAELPSYQLSVMLGAKQGQPVDRLDRCSWVSLGRLTAAASACRLGGGCSWIVDTR